MSASQFEQAMSGIENVFATPTEVLQASDLSPDQRLELLRQWKQDLRQRMSASGEGMIARDPGGTAELLRQVEGALPELPPG